MNKSGTELYILGTQRNDSWMTRNLKHKNCIPNIVNKFMRKNRWFCVNLRNKYHVS